MRTYFSLLRCHQWIKNLFIFMPLFFAFKLNNPSLLGETVIGFFAFSLIASSIYIINDLKDIDFDKNHPLKSARPIASGQITQEKAFIIMLVTLILGMSLAFSINAGFFTICIIYLVMNIFYSFGLKNVNLIDIFLISIGFLLRLFAGSAIANVILSPWIIIQTFLLSVFLAFAKRKDDLNFNTEVNVVRKVLKGYNTKFIEISMSVSASLVIISYILYTLSESVTARLGVNNYLYLSALFVIFGMLRYLQITFVEEQSGSPTLILLKDKFIKLMVFLWLLSCYLVFYFLR